MQLTTVHNEKLKLVFSWITVVCGSLSVILGIIVLIGWYSHNVLLVQVHKSFVPMQYNTASGFLLGGIGLLSTQFSLKRIGLIAGTLVGLVGFLTLIEYIFVLQLGIDQLFMKHYITTKSSHPGRMAPNTAVCFFLIGSFILSSFLLSGKRSTMALSIISSLCTGLGIVALSGYLAEIETAYGWGNLTRMAIHTSIGFILLGTGGFCYSWRINDEETPLPSWFYIPVGIAGVTMAVLVWQALAKAYVNPEIIAASNMNVPNMILIIALAVSSLLTGLIYIGQNLQKSKNTLQVSNDKLSLIRSELELRVQERTRQLKQYTAALERSNKELEQFAYVASHDLQEPLRSVSGFLQLLKRKYKDKIDKSGLHYIERSTAAATRMHNLIQSLLEYSRINTRGNPFELINIEEVLNDALWNLQVSIKESEAIITHDPLPTASVDEGQFVQLFQNLIANGIKFSGEKIPEIHISVDTNDNEYVFSIKDNGIGIEEQYAERIFDIFQRPHTRNDVPGTGIGLSVSKRIVERHGGKIWFESEPDNGTTFYFSIPKERSIEQ